jgi:hypothetical protein
MKNEMIMNAFNEAQEVAKQYINGEATLDEFDDALQKLTVEVNKPSQDELNLREQLENLDKESWSLRNCDIERYQLRKAVILADAMCNDVKNSKEVYRKWRNNIKH